jgi:hypothetical protein
MFPRQNDKKHNEHRRETGRIGCADTGNATKGRGGAGGPAAGKGVTPPIFCDLVALVLRLMIKYRLKSDYVLSPLK